MESIVRSWDYPPFSPLQLIKKKKRTHTKKTTKKTKYYSKNTSKDINYKNSTHTPQIIADAFTVCCSKLLHFHSLVYHIFKNTIPNHKNEGKHVYAQ
jgi:hypothetical protein